MFKNLKTKFKMKNEKTQENSADSIADEQTSAENNTHTNSTPQDSSTDDAAENSDEIVEQTNSHADEVKLLNEKYLRLYSDFENFRKRNSETIKRIEL